jgi:uncharacterized membrane protein YuzA (DUF378 family)
MKAVWCVALVLLIVGGLNWWLVGVADFNLVATIFWDGSTLSKIVYILVWVSAILVAIEKATWGCSKK